MAGAASQRVQDEQRWAEWMAAAAVPALMMQWACVYAPDHILIHHLLPVLAVGAAGALAARLLLPRT